MPDPEADYRRQLTTMSASTLTAEAIRNGRRGGSAWRVKAVQAEQSRRLYADGAPKQETSR